MYDNNNKPKLVYSGSLTLTDKKDAQGQSAGMKGGCVISVTGRDGQQHAGVFIPLEMNPSLFFNPKDRSVVLDINVFQNPAPKFGQTHFIRPSVGKKGQSMSEQARRDATPIIGNLKPFVQKDGQEAQPSGPDLGGNYSPYGNSPQQTAYQHTPQQGGFGPAPQAAPLGAYGPQPAPSPMQEPAPGINPGIIGDLPF